MAAEFHHLEPVILSDDMWEVYQPSLAYDGTREQRQAAYLWAEQKMIQGLSTPLLPTQITGTFAWPFPGRYIQLPHVYVRSVDRVVARARLSGCSCDLTDYEGCALIRGRQGYISVTLTENALASTCGANLIRPWEAEVTYTAGLSTGTASSDTSLHMALTMLARIQFLRITDPGALEGGMGDPGIVSYSGPGYSETRTKESVKPTPFGNSSLANAAWDMVSHLYVTRSLRFS